MVKMGTVWDRTAEFLTDNLPAILPIALFAFFVPLSIQGNFAPVIENAGPELVLALGLISLAFAALVTWGWLTLIAMALESENEPGKLAARRLVPALIVALAMLGVALLLALPVMLTLLSGSRGGTAATLEVPTAVAWPLAIYVIAALIAAIWVQARLTLVYTLIVAEKRWFGSIPRSWKLTRGVGLPIVGVTLLYSLVASVGVLATQAVFGTIFQLVAGSSGGLSLSGVLTSVMVAAAQTGFTVIVPVFTAKLYLALAAAERDRAAAP